MEKDVDIKDKAVKLLKDEDLNVPDLAEDKDVSEEIVDEELLEFETLASSSEKTIELKNIKSTKDLQQYLNQIDVSQAKGYSIYEKFDKWDLISHEKFGMGIVIKILTPRKMEVFFEDGQRLIAMNYPVE